MASQATRSDLMEAFKAILFTRYYRDWAHDWASWESDAGKNKGFAPLTHEFHSLDLAKSG